MSTSPNSSSSSEAPAPGASLAWLMDVSCQVDVVLGTCAVTVRDCLALERGSVVRLMQAAGGDLELRAQGVPLAQGEVVVLDDRTHLRINRILPPASSEAA
jgi:flagellar motor switch protein FliN/FliY